MSDFRLTFFLWLPAYVLVMHAAIQRGLADIWLFAIAMAVAIWSACDAFTLLVRKVTQARDSSRSDS